MSRLSILAGILLIGLLPMACQKTYSLGPLSPPTPTPTPQNTPTSTSSPTATATMTATNTPIPCHLFISQWGTQGTFNSQFDQPTGIAVDSAGDVYVCDYVNDRIKKFNNSGIYITQWACDNPWGVTLDNTGNVYAINGSVILETTNTGVTITQFSPLGGNAGIARDSSNNFYVTGYATCEVLKLAYGGALITTWGSSAPNPGTADGAFDHPQGLAVDPSGNIVVADYQNHRVQKFSPTGVFLSKFGGFGSGPGQLIQPVNITTDPAGNYYVTEQTNNRVSIFSSTGNFICHFGNSGTGPGRFDLPWGVAVDPSGNIFVADWGNNRIEKFGP